MAVIRVTVSLILLTASLLVTAPIAGSYQQTSPQVIEHSNTPLAHNQVVVIGIADNSSRDYARLVRKAAFYWHQHSREHTGRQFVYRVEPNASNPTYQIKPVEEIRGCGKNKTAAPIGVRPSTAPRRTPCQT